MFLLLSAWVGISWSAQLAPATEPAIPGVTLGAAVELDMVGFQHEGLEQNHIDLLLDEAKGFIAFRRERITPKEKLFWIAECFSEKSTQHVFCPFVSRPGERLSLDLDGRMRKIPRDRKAEKAAAKEKVAASRKIADALKDNLGNADLAGLLGFSEGQFHRALGKFNEWAPLQPLTDGALASGACPSPQLLVALAQKSEQFFPNELARRRSIALYERAISCATPETASDESIQKARYRSSLLYVWANQCEKAEPQLTELGKIPDSEFASRSLFWRAWCAQKSGNKMQAKIVRTRLTKEFPLSYHGLLLDEGRPSEVKKSLDLGEPTVLFRSTAKPELNPSVRAAELMLHLKSHDLAMEILNSLTDDIEGSEPDFRFYVALLFGRSGDKIGQFRTLAGVFRQKPSLISRRAMELFYPLKRFEVLKAQQRLDPFFVAALIRQESGFNERARSPAGALGLMQLMPGTARRIERVSQRQLMDPTINVRLGTRYFSSLLQRYQGDAELSLAAYNAGPERVDDWRRRYPTDNRILFFDLIPFKETRDYVALIARNYYWYLSLYDDRDSRLKDVVGNNPSQRAGRPLTFTLLAHRVLEWVLLDDFRAPAACT